MNIGVPMRTETYQRVDGEWVTHVYLSRRNLEALRAKLNGHPAESACTIQGPVMYPTTFVTAEEDDLHYAHSSRGEHVGEQGPMHPETEAVIAGRGDPEYGLVVR